MLYSGMLDFHTSRMNDVLYFIHQDISRDLTGAQLAGIAAYSEQHFHRVFRKTVGETLHQYILRTRLETAANQLMFDTASSVLEIANNCGFASVSSFSRMFKRRFSISPGRWRNRDLSSAMAANVSDADIAKGYADAAHSVFPDPNICEVPERFVAYVRHQGYDRSIRNAWLLLIAWAKTERRDSSLQFGLHHSNPAWVPLNECRYVACIAIDSPLKVRGKVNQLRIPGGLHAVFSLQGTYGELLPQISQIMAQWLPCSGFRMATTPAYVHYHKNHFLAADGRFALDFYLPLQF